MPKLNCNVKNCYYNESKQCCRDEIQVQGEEATVVDATYCGNFKEKLDSVTAKTCHCESAPEEMLTVKCEAKNCIYNDNAKCHAAEIGISGNGAKHQSQTECGSFECSCV
jgi:hypothetical protein